MAIIKPFNPRWNYTGDINIEHGGLFWRRALRDPFPEADYVEAVRVTPYADMGGPDNVFHIETGSIYMPRDKYETALDTCGYELGQDDRGGLYIIAPTGPKPSVNPVDSSAGLRLLVDAFNAYYGLERDAMNGETVVRVGPHDRYGPDEESYPEPDYVLRANASLKRFVRAEFLA